MTRKIIFTSPLIDHQGFQTRDSTFSRAVAVFLVGAGNPSVYMDITKTAAASKPSTRRPLKASALFEATRTDGAVAYERSVPNACPASAKPRL
jgi:hypothetical protein